MPTFDGLDPADALDTVRTCIDLISSIKARLQKVKGFSLELSQWM